MLSRILRLGATALVVITAAAGGISACGTNPAALSLNTGSVNACYRGLPAARQALHEASAKLKGVHRMQVDKLQKAIPGFSLPPGDHDTEVCTFAFEGKFAPGQVTAAPATAQGPFAIVVVSIKHLTLVTSYVGAELPKTHHLAAARG